VASAELKGRCAAVSQSLVHHLLRGIGGVASRVNAMMIWLYSCTDEWLEALRETSESGATLPSIEDPVGRQFEFTDLKGGKHQLPLHVYRERPPRIPMLRKLMRTPKGRQALITALNKANGPTVERPCSQPQGHNWEDNFWD